MRALYRSTSWRRRQSRRRRRLPTISSRPRRLWWSCLWVRRCSVRWLMRSVSRATWTSGDPVSLSWVPYSATISDVAFITRLLLVQRGIARNGTTFLYPNPTRRQLFRPGHVAVHLLDE